MPAMIALDLDNTLLRSDATMSPYTISVLAKCQQKGIKIAYATARSTQAAAKMLAQFAPDIFIGYGGSWVTADNKVLYRSDIPADISAKLIQECLQTPGVSYIYAAGEGNKFLTNNPDYLDHPHYKYCDFSSELNSNFLKISIEAEHPSVVTSIAANYPMLDTLGFHGENLYRFANKNATKWNAVKAVATYYGIDTNAIIAFGDDRIDLEMLQNCGTGVAVANAIADVKAAANHICDTNNNDGVAKWLEEYVLS